MGRECTAYGRIQICLRGLVGRPERKGPLGRPRIRWENNIKMDLRKVDCDARNWMDLT